MSAYLQLDLGLADPLPPYTLRRSRRARYLSVRVTPQHGVTVILPAGLDERTVEPFLHEHRDWLLRELESMAHHPTARERGRLPRQVALAALRRTFELHYATPGGAPVRVGEHADGLRVSGATDDKQAVCSALRRWLARVAKRELLPRLDLLAMRSGLAYTRCTIRGQRGRWGSGSTSGQLNLNYKLLFLAPALVDYVLLHELTHTRHPDHSRRFWRHLERLLPECHACHAELQAAGVSVPWWAEQPH